MTTYPVRLSVAAQEDISAIETWIAGRADEIIAARYIDRIERYLMQLSVFPNRGSPRPDIAPDARSVTFERRYLILYSVTRSDVTILRVFASARDLAKLSDS